MNIKEGEVYICTEPYCRAEIVVRRGADTTCHGKYEIRCCCGKEMVREDKLQFAEPKRAAKTGVIALCSGSVSGWKTSFLNEANDTKQSC